MSETEHELSEVSEEAILVQQALELSAEKFASLKVADRDVILFLMLRDLYATMEHLSGKVDEYEDKARQLATPEGLQGIMNKFLDGGMGGLGGGLGMLGMLK